MEFETLILLLIFQVKHYIADYPLQFSSMYENKENKEGWIEPLFLHSLTHAGMTYLIVSVYMSFFTYSEELTVGYLVFVVLIASAFDMSTHFVTAMWRAAKRKGPNTKSFWINLGIDQMVHRVAGVIIVFYIVAIV